GERHRPLADQVVPVAVVELVLPHPDDELQVAAGRPRIARVPLPRVANPVPGIDPGGDFHLDRPAGLDPAVAPAGVARVGDDRALPAARPARLLDRQEPLLEHDDALPAAAAARVWLRARLGPVPAAVAAQLLAGERLGPLDPGRGLDEVDVEHRP